MHSPGRNNYLYASPPHSFQNENRNLSNSALVLAPAAKLVNHKPMDFNHHTKPLPIPPKQPYPLPSTITTTTTTVLPTSSHLNQHRSTQQMQQHQQIQQQQQTSPSRPTQLRRTASSASSASTNLLNNPTNIEIESPKNMTVVQPAKFQPYKEESKPFEMSDFYKYSTKFRQKNIGSETAAD